MTADLVERIGAKAESWHATPRHDDPSRCLSCAVLALIAERKILLEAHYCEYRERGKGPCICDGR